MSTTVVDVLTTQVEALTGQLAHLLPWVKELSAPDQVALIADLMAAYKQMGQDGDRTVLLTVLEDWEATVQVLRDPALTSHMQALGPPTEYVSWETVDADLPRDPTP